VLLLSYSLHADHIVVIETSWAVAERFVRVGSIHSLPTCLGRSEVSQFFLTLLGRLTESVKGGASLLRRLLTRSNPVQKCRSRRRESGNHNYRSLSISYMNENLMLTSRNSKESNFVCYTFRRLSATSILGTVICRECCHMNTQESESIKNTRHSIQT